MLKITKLTIQVKIHITEILRIFIVVSLQQLISQYHSNNPRTKKQKKITPHAFNTPPGKGIDWRVVVKDHISKEEEKNKQM